MTAEEVTKLAAGLAHCANALMQIAEALQVLPEGETAERKPDLTLEAVRKVAADKARQGFTEEVRGLIKKYGADKLSGVPAEQYDAFLAELELMGHA